MTTTPERSSAAGLPPGYRMTELDPADRTLIESVASWAFATAGRPEEDAIRPFPLEQGRIVGIWSDGEPPRPSAGPGQERAPELAALHASYAFPTFGVPGATLPAAGLTWVSVHPQHRRRRLASAMVRAHLERTAGRGEALSALFTSEPGIYGQFGYGRAAHHVTLVLPRRPILRPVGRGQELTVRVEAAGHDRHGDVVGKVHSASRRPGWARRTTPALAAAVFADLPSQRDGAEPLRIASVWDASGEPRAYALFARRSRWTRWGVSEGTASVREATALDGAAAHVLWSFLTDLDLIASVETPMLAPDDPLLTLLVNTRNVDLRMEDNVWVRLVDLPRALTGRSYACGVEVVLEVTDELLPANAGRWRLSGSVTSGASTLTPTTEDADLALDIRELGTAYLGGVTLGSLAAAGLVEERTPGALAAASTAFGWPEAPVCNWLF